MTDVLYIMIDFFTDIFLWFMNSSKNLLEKSPTRNLPTKKQVQKNCTNNSFLNINFYLHLEQILESQFVSGN